MEVNVVEADVAVVVCVSKTEQLGGVGFLRECDVHESGIGDGAGWDGDGAGASRRGDGSE